MQQKKNSWDELCNKLQEDIWGDGYRIAVKHLSKPSQPYQLTKERRIEIVEELFPQSLDNMPEPNINEEVPPTFKIEELEKAAARIKTGRAPGPDRILPEAMKITAACVPESFWQSIMDYSSASPFRMNGRGQG